MRVYVYQPGYPGCVSAVVAVSEQEWRELEEYDVPRKGLGVLPQGPGEIFTREEMHEVSTRRRALEAWEALDDTPFQVWSEEDEYQGRENYVKELFMKGCPDAARLMVEGMSPDAIAEYVRYHVCRHEIREP